MVVAVTPEHPFAYRECIQAEDLAGQAFVGFDDDLPIHHEIERYLRDHRVNVDVVFRFDNIQMIKEAVTHGVGISIMPERVMHAELAQGRLVALKLRDGDLFRPVFIVHRRKKVFNQVAQGLMEILLAEVPSEAGHLEADHPVAVASLK
jgi:DNA-binding transcriptional LysR family regulator